MKIIKSTKHIVRKQTISKKIRKQKTKLCHSVKAPLLIFLALIAPF